MCPLGRPMGASQGRPPLSSETTGWLLREQASRGADGSSQDGLGWGGDPGLLRADLCQLRALDFGGLQTPTLEARVPFFFSSSSSLSLSLFFLFTRKDCRECGSLPFALTEAVASLTWGQDSPKNWRRAAAKTELSNDLFQMTGDSPVERGSEAPGCLRRELGVQTSGASAPRPAAQGSPSPDSPLPRPLFQLCSPLGP